MNQDSQPARVLVVDDKTESLYLLKILLMGNGYVVDEARHGAEALARARRRAPDLVISDLLMPVMDGYTLLREWKAEARLQAVPFVVYTATFTDSKDEQLALDLGADAFLVKPAEPEELVRVLREILAKARAGALPGTRRPVANEWLATKYNEVLVRKLEEKARQLEAANRTLELDLAQRRRAEAEAVKANERIREQATLLDIAADGIMVRDLQHRILFWNKGCERLYGWTAEEAVGRVSPELLAPERATFEAAFAAIMQADNWTGELRHLTRRREEITVLSRWSLVRNERGQPKSVLVINTDITERKKLHAQLVRAQRLESIGQLASGIAHDLNNILAPLTMVTPLLRSEITNPATLRLVDMMEANTRRGADIVKQVLTFSRGLKTGKAPVPVRSLVKEVGSMLSETLPKSISVRITSPENIWLVEADATQVHQVIMNLCVNARDAMPDGGVLGMELENVEVDEVFAAQAADVKAGPYVALLVSDTGMGIPPENMERIFDPFFSTKEPGKGTGLGLSTVLGIVRDHGGFIRLTSGPGQGTRFRVYFPASHEPKTDVPLVPVTPPQGRGETILIVDDEETVRMMMRKILERFGYHVLVAGEGGAALALYAEQGATIHAVVTDLVMPEMDGVEFVRELRKRAPSLRIMAVTGAAETAEASAALAEGVQHLLQKPFSAEALLHGVRTLLDEPVGEPTDERRRACELAAAAAAATGAAAPQVKE